MKLSAFVLSLVTSLIAMNDALGEKCGPDEKTLHVGEPCMPAHLVNYLYCLEHSGGGKISVKESSTDDKHSALQISIGGEGSGVIFKGKGSGTMSKSDSEKITKDIEETLNPSLAAICKKLEDEVFSSSNFTGGGSPEPPWPENLKQYRNAFALLKFSGVLSNTQKKIELTAGGVVIAPGIIATSEIPFGIMWSPETVNHRGSIVARTFSTDGVLSEPRPVELASVVDGSSKTVLLRFQATSHKDAGPYVAATSDISTGQHSDLEKNREIVVFVPDYEAGRFHVRYGKITDEFNNKCNVELLVNQDGAPVFTRDTGQFVGLLTRGQEMALRWAYFNAHLTFESNVDTYLKPYDLQQIEMADSIRLPLQPKIPPPPPRPNG
ncbi:hypothetical protein [Caballeronia novacaledonica]|uniref:Uncharacterized protein n=1 Tax=Caballeronia novacaledonica TaxID=1544861 RepID=A0AA37I5Q4_9BURK|nr:hypothetical protein [Caballeronia novacaledonica]GJH23811.1 hypothetical protein CBA19CS42_04865 [Caballeronia novacaledonica]